MSKCKSKRTNGKPCGAAPISGSDFCFMHDPKSDDKAKKHLNKINGKAPPPHSPTKSTITTFDELLKVSTEILHEVRSELISHQIGTSCSSLLKEIKHQLMEKTKVDPTESTDDLSSMSDEVLEAAVIQLVKESK